MLIRSITDPAEARRFCEHHECPNNWKDANGENCCIHHANIHSCPMGYMVQTLITKDTLESHCVMSSNAVLDLLSVFGFISLQSERVWNLNTSYLSSWLDHMYKVFYRELHTLKLQS